MNETTPYSGKDQLADIASDGDLVLIVGVEKVRLRVSSQCLRYATKVFAKMFGPDWYEGERLSKKLPCEITLLYDDAKAMRTICSVIHHRNGLVPENLTPKDVLHIAIEVYRYDLRNALKYAILEWLEPRITVGMVETGRLLAAAFLLDNSCMFMAHIQTLLLHHSESYLGLMNDELINKILPAGICCML
jgi:hypothetical protein